MTLCSPVDPVVPWCRLQLLSHVQLGLITQLGTSAAALVVACSVPMCCLGFTMWSTSSMSPITVLQLQLTCC